MSPHEFVFYGFAGLAVATSLVVVTLRNVARSLFLFFIVLFAMAGLYVFALADFVAVTQLLIYVGGVLILMLFAFMLANRTVLERLRDGTANLFALPVWQALVISTGFFVALICTVLSISDQDLTWIQLSQSEGYWISSKDNNVQHLGINLMTRFIIPFEVVSVLLLMALIGASHLARKGEDK